MGGPPGELVWVGNVEAKTKNLRLRILQRIRLNQGRERAADCGQGRLIFEMFFDKDTIPEQLIPDAALVYRILRRSLL